MVGIPDALTRAAILLLVALMASYLLGREQKDRLVRSRAEWLRLALGQRYAEPRLAATGYGFTATAQLPEGPARRIDASLFLLPREIPPLWLVRALGGATDLLTFWVSLRAAPAAEGDAFDLRVPVGRRAARLLPSTWVHRREPGLLLAAPSELHLERLRELADVLRQDGLLPVFASVRSQAPHLQVTFQAPATLEQCRAAVQAVWLATRLLSSERLLDPGLQPDLH
ncbi:hypothetical protein NET02_08490 [Thermomicrobiaceae bacterium CFH 74404]|uniref:Uncharacterized protein n=1 Tax=Thermalbibacter longus TaxID=2951981 RepID=A0AA41WFM8_9BACT|nr:hypothetical protein [Thermalbibacter longus]MCM8749180.1 hypothetical protein [Thermalbibacter longus]